VWLVRGRIEMCKVFLVGKPEGKTELGMSRRTRENNIKIYLKNNIRERELDWLSTGKIPGCCNEGFKYCMP